MSRAAACAPAPALRLRRIDLASDGQDGTARGRARANRERPLRALLARRIAPIDPATRRGAAAILADVRRAGDDAVRAANRRFGGGLAGDRLVIARPELVRARDALPPDIRAALLQAIEHVERFAVTQRPATTRTEVIAGIEIERRWLPLDRVGCYVPGGSASYPSSLVMTVVPARVAGVPSIVVASPADKDGRVDPVLLGAAGLLGVETVVVAGGAQAIGALAYGLPGEGFEPVPRIVGPGNAWVTAAKIEVSAEVAIDLPAGPSEGMVVADEGADPVLVAADLVTQAEHGPDSPAILVTTSPSLADRVDVEIDALVSTLERRDILARSLSNHGAIVLVRDLARAIEVVNAYAPEHLSIDVADLEATVAAIRHAGSVFVGRWAPESAGDYATGANHVLPTGGLARACGPLAVESYGHFVQVQRLSREGLAEIRGTVSTLATAEGLTAHRHAIEVRFRAETALDAETTASVPARWFAGLRGDTPPGSVEVTARDRRRVTVRRQTRETEVEITLDLDGAGETDVTTGVGFFDHLLSSLGHHGLFDLTVRVRGDLEVDEHHTVEDTALVLGAAFAEAIGERAGIARFGDASVPMDESLATAVVDTGGRPYAVVDLPFRGERVGALPLQLVEHALEAFARTAGVTLHLRGTGRNDHHLAEASFKALGRALRAAVEPDPRRRGVASTKGVLG